MTDDESYGWVYSVMPDFFFYKDVYNFTLCQHFWTWQDKRFLIGYGRYCACGGGGGDGGRDATDFRK